MFYSMLRGIAFFKRGELMDKQEIKLTAYAEKAG